MTERFVGEVLCKRKPALAVLRLGHPDTTQHCTALGSPEHLAALAEADRHVGTMIDAVSTLRHRGDDILLLVGSDYGHQTVTGAVDIDAALIAAGLKNGAASDDVVVAPNSTAALVYLAEAVRDRSDAIAPFLNRQPWTDRVVPAERARPSRTSAVPDRRGSGLFSRREPSPVHVAHRHRTDHSDPSRHRRRGDGWPRIADIHPHPSRRLL